MAIRVNDSVTVRWHGARHVTQRGGTDMYDSLAKAAAATGVTKSTILRAIRSHRISAAKSETGDWQIDPAELHRVFPPARNEADRAGNGTAERGATAAERHESAFEAQIAGLREVAELLRRQLDDVRADRDAWREQAQAGQRLLLPPAAPPGRRPWWRRLARRA
jgi:hypothetical protein